MARQRTTATTWTTPLGHVSHVYLGKQYNRICNAASSGRATRMDGAADLACAVPPRRPISPADRCPRWLHANARLSRSCRVGAKAAAQPARQPRSDPAAPGPGLFDDLRRDRPPRAAGAKFRSTAPLMSPESGFALTASGDDGGPTQYDDVSLTKQRKLWCPVPRQPHLHVKHQLPPTCRRNALASRRSCASAQTPFPFSPALSLLGAASHALSGSVYLTAARNPWNRRVWAQVYPSARAAVGGAAFLRGLLPATYCWYCLMA